MTDFHTIDGNWAEAVPDHVAPPIEGAVVELFPSAYISTEAAANLAGGRDHLNALFTRRGTGYSWAIARLASNAILHIVPWCGNPSRLVHEIWSDAPTPEEQLAEINAALQASARPRTYGFLKIEL